MQLTVYLARHRPQRLRLDTSGCAVGQRVQHATFGEGIVVAPGVVAFGNQSVRMT